MELQFCPDCVLVFETVGTPKTKCHQCGRALVPYDGVLSNQSSDPDEIDFDESEDRTRVMGEFTESDSLDVGFYDTLSANLEGATQIIRSSASLGDGPSHSQQATRSIRPIHRPKTPIPASNDATQSLLDARNLRKEGAGQVTEEITERSEELDATKITHLDELSSLAGSSGTDTAELEVTESTRKGQILDAGKDDVDGFLEEAEPTLALDIESALGHTTSSADSSKNQPRLAKPPAMPPPIGDPAPPKRTADTRSPQGLQRSHAAPGPDPTPQARVPRRPTVRRVPSPVQSDRATDKAAPVPVREGQGAQPNAFKPSKSRIEYPFKAASSAKGTPPSVPAQSIPSSRQGGRDLIAELVDSHLDQPVADMTLEPRQKMSKGRRGDVVLRVVLVALISLVVGVGITLFFSDGQRSGEQAQEGASGKEGIETALRETGLQVPAIKWAQEISYDQPYLVLGAHQAYSSEGELTALGYSDVQWDTLSPSKYGPVLPSVVSAFEGAGARQTLVMGLPADLQLGQYASLCRSALASEFAEAALLVQREDGLLGFLPIGAIQKKAPSVGHIVIFVGPESISADVVRMDGSHMSQPADPPLSRRADGRLDLRGLDARLGSLSKTFPRVKVALLKLDQRMSIEDAMPIIARARFGQNEGEERFTTIRLSLYESK